MQDWRYDVGCICGFSRVRLCTDGFMGNLVGIVFLDQCSGDIIDAQDKTNPEEEYTVYSLLHTQ